MSERLQVCHVVNSVGPTSIPADIATALAEYTDVEASLLSWFDAEPFAGDDLVEVHSLGAGRDFVDYDAYRRAKATLADVDVIQTHHNHAGVYAKVVGARLRTPVVRTEQNTHDGYTRVGKLANGLTTPLATRVTCISEAVYDSFEWWEKLLASHKQEVIYNGVDFDRIESSTTGTWSLSAVADVDQEALVVGNAAMLTEQKAHDTLVRAVATANQDGDRPVELVVAGDGALREDLSALARDLGVRGRVHFLGLLDRGEVYQLLADVDAFCMPSRWEGFCVAVAEAMAVGVPCLLSDIDVFEELYGEAALFHPVDDDAALAERLRNVAVDEALREDLSAKGQELVRTNYSLPEIAREYERLYREIA